MKLILVRFVLEPKGVGERAEGISADKRWKTGGFKPPHTSSPSYATENWLPDKICISCKNTDVFYMYYCLHNFVWTNQTMINFVYALFHVSIDSDLKKKT